MNKNAIKEISKKHNGKTYTFSIGVLAKNVDTDNNHQFVTNKEKEQIKKIESIEQDFRDGCDILVSTCTTYGETPESNSPSDIANAIEKIYNKRYNQGYNKGIADATPKIERKNFEVNIRDNGDDTQRYTFQSTGIAYLTLHLCGYNTYPCETGVSDPGYDITIGGKQIFSNYPWKNVAVDEGEVTSIECFQSVAVTEGQQMVLHSHGCYLGIAHIRGSVIVVS